MNILPILAASAGAGHLDPVKLFLGADIVVQAVIAGLLLASVWVWTIIVAFSLRLGRVRRRCDAYEREFWTREDFEALQDEKGKGDVPFARIAEAGLAEWRRAKGGAGRDAEGVRQRIASAMDGIVASEGDRLAGRLNFLATVGSVAPFVGLFGTVWGIMNSFFQIGQQQNSSLAVVAPGISEALFATAIGLFAAIPAVIAYNRFSNRVGLFEARMQRFADKLHASLTRDLEGG
ncbi:MAG: protein TolQ [Novosphingobium sp.]